MGENYKSWFFRGWGLPSGNCIIILFIDLNSWRNYRNKENKLYQFLLFSTHLSVEFGSHLFLGVWILLKMRIFLQIFVLTFPLLVARMVLSILSILSIFLLFSELGTPLLVRILVIFVLIQKSIRSNSASAWMFVWVIGHFFL